MHQIFSFETVELNRTLLPSVVPIYSLVLWKEGPTSKCGQSDPTSTSTKEVTIVDEGSFSRQNRSDEVAGVFSISSINKFVVVSGLNFSWELREALRDM
jgi:hypothetical protein